jgi:hypothetical protein
MQRLSKIDDGSSRVGDFFIVSSPGSVPFLGCTECDRVQPLRSPYTDTNDNSPANSQLVDYCLSILPVESESESERWR